MEEGRKEEEKRRARSSPSSLLPQSFLRVPGADGHELEV